MALQLILGRAGSGKSYTLIQKIISLSMKMEEKNFVAVVPEQYSMETQKEILTLHPNHGCFNIEVTSLTRLAYAIFEELGVNDLNVMDDLGKTLVIRKVLEDCKDKLYVYKNKVKMMGFTDKVKTLISEFRQYSINQESLNDIEGKVEDYPTLKLKIQDLEIINNEFNKFIENRAITNEDLLSLLCEYIPKSEYVKNTYFYFDSFTGFTPIQYKVIEQLLKYSPHVSLAVTLPEEQVDFKGYDAMELFSLSKETIVKIRELAIKNSVEIEPNIVIDLERNQAQKENSRLGNLAKPLAFVEENIFRNTKKAQYKESNDNIRIYALNNPKGEAEYVAGEISKLIKSGDYRYNDIAVIAGDIESYHKYIEQAFEKYDLPCFIDHKEDILANKYVDGILAALDVINKDFSHQTVMRFVRLKFMELDENMCDIFENYILKSNRRGYRSYVKNWEKVYPFMEEGHIEIVNTIREQIVEGLQELRDEFIKKDATVFERTKAVYLFTVKHNIQDKIQKKAEEFREKKVVALEKEYSQIYESVINVFDRLVALMDDEIVTTEEYNDILEAGLSQVKIGIIPPGIDTIMVGNIERTRLKDTKKILFFLGMNDGIVPKNSTPGGIITDSERDILKSKDYKLAPTTRENIFKQRIYLYSLFAKPLEQIVLCYSKSDSDGSTLRKSYIIGILEKMFPNMKEKHFEEIEIPVSHITNKKVALQYVAENINAYRNGEDNPRFNYLSKILLSDKSTAKIMNLILEGGFYNNNRNDLMKEYAKKLYGIPGNIGITRLENYAKCAYSQFLSYGLKLKEREKFSIEAYDIGNLYHITIQKFFEMVNSKQLQWKEITDEKSSELIKKAVKYTFEKYDNEALEGSARNAFITNQVKEIAEKTVKVLINHINHGKFKPAEYEIPLEHGIVDRIDTYETDDKLYVKVIDYKSSEKVFDITKAYNGIQMQLLVYINDAINYEKKKTSKEILPAAGLYFNIRDPYMNISGTNDLIKIHRDVNKEDTRTDEEILKEIVFKQQLPKFQMSGIVCDSKEVIDAVDEDVENNNESKIVKVSYDKSGNPKKTSQILDEQTYSKLIKHVSNKADELKNDLLSGKISINPIEEQCRYCSYKGICRFDQALGDKYRQLESVSFGNIGELLNEVDR